MQEARADLRVLEERMAEVLQLHSQPLKAGVGKPGKEGTSKHSEWYQEWCDLLRTARQRKTESA